MLMFADGHLLNQLIHTADLMENFVILLTWIRIRVDQILWIRNLILILIRIRIQS